MTTTRFIISIVVLLLTVYIVVMNWGCVLVSLQNKRRGISRHHSTVPIVSIFLAVLAYQIYPYLQKNWIGFIPLFDVGNWTLLWLPIIFIKGLRHNQGKQE